MTRTIKAGFLASTVLVLGVVSTSVNAASISTGVADWKFASYTALAGAANSGLVYTDTIAAQGSSAVEITRNSAWVAPTALSSESGLSWISALSNGASNGLYGFYTYSLTLDGLSNPALIAGKQYEVAGKFTSDNLIDSFTVNGSQVLSGYTGPTEQSFKFVYTVPTSVGIAPLTILARIYNESTVANAQGTFGTLPTGPNAPGSTSNPTGFILTGTVTLVPLPPAAFAGLGLMGACGVMSLVRRARA